MHYNIFEMKDFMQFAVLGNGGLESLFASMHVSGLKIGRTSKIKYIAPVNKAAI